MPIYAILTDITDHRATVVDLACCYDIDERHPDDRNIYAALDCAEPEIGERVWIERGPAGRIVVTHRDGDHSDLVDMGRHNL